MQLVALSLAASALTFGAATELPQPTPVCALAAAPESFDGKMVTVRARVHIEFESFTLAIEDCGLEGDRTVALEYGRGPKEQPAIWCCGDLTPRDPLRLEQDAAFHRFHRLLTAQSRGCRGARNCYHHDVTATLTGRIDVAKHGPCGTAAGEACLAGFGHFNMAPARLVISRVADVVAAPNRQGRPSR